MPRFSEIKISKLGQEAGDSKFDQISGTNTEYSPGAGVVFIFIDPETNKSFIIASHKPNPDINNQIQSAITIGGMVQSGMSLDQHLKNVINTKANVNVGFNDKGWIIAQEDSFFNQFLAVKSGQTIVVYNQDVDEGPENKWNMSYVTLVQEVLMPLSDLKATVDVINKKAATLLALSPKARISQYAIYDTNDILDIVYRNANLAESAKEPEAINNYLDNKVNKVIVFDDYATSQLFKELGMGAELAPAGTPLKPSAN